MGHADRPHPVLNAAALIAGLADGSLPPARFGHEAHLMVARELLLQAPAAEAERRFCELLRGYVRGLGAEDKFHLSLSIALLRLIAVRLRPEEDWPAFRTRCPELFGEVRSLLAVHYSDAGLAAGRHRFVAPDRLPLP